MLWPARAVGEWWVEAAVHNCVDMCLVLACSESHRALAESPAARTAYWVRMLGIGCSFDNATRSSGCCEQYSRVVLVLSEMRMVELSVEVDVGCGGDDRG